MTDLNEERFKGMKIYYDSLNEKDKFKFYHGAMHNFNNGKKVPERHSQTEEEILFKFYQLCFPNETSVQNKTAPADGHSPQGGTGGKTRD